MLQRRLLNKLLHRCHTLQSISSLQVKSLSSDQQFYSHLTHRKLVEVSGVNAFKLIQGIVTNDVDTLSPSSPLLYSHILNVKGRVLFDTLIYYRSDDTLSIEVDSGLVGQFVKTLMMYNLRSKVKIKRSEEGVYAVYGAGTQPCERGLADPRLPDLGYRYLTSPPSGVTEASIDTYHAHRVKLGVGEGNRDIVSGSAFPFEHNLDYLNGVSFTKGCYIGQELTARTHHVGETRKRVVPVTLDQEIELTGSSKLLAGKRGAGKLLSLYGTQGLAIVRFPHLGAKLLVEGTTASLTASKPNWWPEDKV